MSYNRECCCDDDDNRNFAYGMMYKMKTMIEILEVVCKHTYLATKCKIDLFK